MGCAFIHVFGVNNYFFSIKISRTADADCFETITEKGWDFIYYVNLFKTTIW